MTLDSFIQLYNNVFNELNRWAGTGGSVSATMEMLSNGLSDSAGIGKGTIGGIAAAVTGVGLVLKSYQKVETGQVGVKTFMGKVRRHRRGELKGKPKIVGAGAHPTFPGVHAINTIGVKERSTDLEAIEVDLIGESGRKLQKLVRASIDWAVSPEDDHPYLALYEKIDLGQFVTNCCTDGLRASISDTNGEYLSNSKATTKDVQERIKDDLITGGVLLTAIRITTETRSAAQVIAGPFEISRHSPDSDIIPAAIGSDVIDIPGVQNRGLTIVEGGLDSSS